MPITQERMTKLISAGELLLSKFAALKTLVDLRRESLVDSIRDLGDDLTPQTVETLTLALSLFDEISDEISACVSLDIIMTIGTEASHFRQRGASNLAARRWRQSREKNPSTATPD